MYELFIEGQKADINDQISIQLSFAIDDIRSFATRETSFSKQIVLPGTGNNNAIFGHISEMGSNNPFSPGQPNIGSAFNVAQTSKAELRLNGLLVLRGVFRITGIIRDKDLIEYEGALFGELSGLMSEISNKKLDDLDFSDYDHALTHTNIESSWDNTPGSGYFYPLIDYGNYRNGNDYDFGTLRPAFFVKEYIDKIFEAAGYTYQSDFINTDDFKRLIIPHNAKELTNNNPIALNRDADETFNAASRTYNIPFPSGDLGLFTTSDNKTFTLGGATGINATIRASVNIVSYNGFVNDFRLQIRKGSTTIKEITIGALGTHTVSIENVALAVGDTITIRFADLTIGSDMNYTGNVLITTDTPVQILAQYNSTLYVNDSIPKGIFQKDFLASIIKMFNLYITESREDEKKLIIEPYIDFMSTDTIDWTYKVAMDKAWQIRPMGNLNARIFEYKYKDDNDFYNESYRKKFNLNYGDRQFDTGFQFSKDKQTTDIIFASSPLIQYSGEDKLLTAIYKKSNELAAEDRTESIIRILYSKKLSCNSWNIKQLTNNFAKTSYGYAGHLDNPSTPTRDLNFGAPSEVYYSVTTYPSANLFNEYWDEYIAQIADKDSKILECYVYLTPLDIAQLDFSKSVFIDGIRFRINKVSDYDVTNNELVKVELLKIIENG